MKTNTQTMRFDDLPKTYSGLIELHMLRPISDDVDLENATELMDLLAGHKLTKDQEDYLDVISDLVDKYESENSPLNDDDLDPVDALRFLMEQHDMSASEVGRLLGDRSLGSRILNGKREISKAHAVKLADHFAVSRDVFI